MLRASLTTLSTFALLALAASCTGDDPAAVTDVGDAGGDATSSVDSATDPDGEDPHSGHDAGGDAAPTSCFGKPFAPVKDIATASLVGIDPLTPTWGPRIVGTTAYFAARADVAGALQTVFAAPWTVGAGSSASLGAPTELVAITHPTLPTWSPVVDATSTVMLVAAGNSPGFGAPQRDLYASTFNGAAWGTPAVASALNSLDTADDEADPWIVGSPPKAVYFARQPSGGAMTIARATMALVVASPPTFGAPSPVAIECAGSNCGTPVVTADEAHIVFGRWAPGGFIPRVVEIELVVNAGQAGAAPGAELVEHPELGAAYPSWMSDDGCRLVASRGAGMQLVYATR